MPVVVASRGDTEVPVTTAREYAREASLVRAVDSDELMLAVVEALAVTSAADLVAAIAFCWVEKVATAPLIDATRLWR